jgi:hypothetical protein
MRRIFVYIISILGFLGAGLSNIRAQDTVMIPLKIKLEFELSGPIIYHFDKATLNYEGNLVVDLDEKYSALLGVGYVNSNYSQYNYEAASKGGFMRAGVDINMLKPQKSKGKFWVGTGIRYGLSHFTTEVPLFTKENYWGKVSSSLPMETNWSHYLELSPGVRAEIFKNISIGWSINIRKLIGGTYENLKPVYIPGYGNGAKAVTADLKYFIIWNIPYKKKRVIIQKEEPEEEDEEDMDIAPNNQNNNQQYPGSNQQYPGSNQSSGSRNQFDR